MAISHDYPCMGCALGELLLEPTDRRDKRNKIIYKRVWTCSRNGESFAEMQRLRKKLAEFGMLTGCSGNVTHGE